jgi:hypothetical protein
VRFCGCPESFGAGTAQVKLPTSRVTFFVRDVPPGIARADFEALHMESWQRWARVIGITVDKHANPKTDTTQIVTVADLDGPNGVLADQMLPYGAGVNLVMRIDRVGPWYWATGDQPPANQINGVAVLTHENGHCLGLQHLDPQGDPDLMNPTYSPRIFLPQEDDISYGRKLYGPPIATPPPPPPPPGGKPITVTVEQGGMRWTGIVQRVS